MLLSFKTKAARIQKGPCFTLFGPLYTVRKTT